MWPFKKRDAAADASRPPAPGFSDEWRHLESGLRIHYRDYPPAGETARAAPVFCFHGLTRNTRDFEEIAPRIAALGRRVIAPSQLGRGLSDADPDPERYAPANYAAEMLAMMDALAIERAAVIGTSLGGLMAMIMAAAAPNRLTGVVLNDVGPEIAPEGMARIRSYVGGDEAPATDWAEAARRTRAINGPAFPNETDEAFWLAFAKRIYEEGDDGLIRLDYDPAIAKPVREGDSATPDLWPLYDALADIPVLLVRGAMSDILAPDVAERMKERKPDLVLAEVDGVGHAPLLTEPAAWSAIERFLGDVD